MFCKWCGGTLTPAETKCKRCGKEIPARSDCGGFYDLVPTAKPPVEKVADGIHPDRRVDPVSNFSQNVVDPKLDKKTPKKKKVNGGPLLLVGAMTLLCFFVLFLQILLLNGKIAQQTEKMNGLKNDLNTLGEQIQELHGHENRPTETAPEQNNDNTVVPSTSPSNPESTEPAQTTPPSTEASTAAPSEPLQTAPPPTEASNAATTEPSQPTTSSTPASTAATTPPVTEPELSEDSGTET